MPMAGFFLFFEDEGLVDGCLGFVVRLSGYLMS